MLVNNKNAASINNTRQALWATQPLHSVLEGLASPITHTLSPSLQKVISQYLTYAFGATAPPLSNMAARAFIFALLASASAFAAFSFSSFRDFTASAPDVFWAFLL